MAIILSGDTANTYGVLQVANATVTTNAVYVSVANGNIGLGGNSTPAHDVAIVGSLYTSTSANVTTTLGAGNTTIAGFVNATSTAQATRFISTIANGTSPLQVTSTTLVANLNADMLDGYQSTSFAFANSVSQSFHQLRVHDQTGDLYYIYSASTDSDAVEVTSDYGQLVSSFIALNRATISKAANNSMSIISS